jgi:hypothetical protein
VSLCTLNSILNATLFTIILKLKTALHVLAMLGLSQAIALSTQANVLISRWQK